jgi:hypothetical protein
MIELTVEPKLCLLDDILLEIYDYIPIKDLFRWLTVSKQFNECIHRSLNARKCIFIYKSYPFGCVSTSMIYLKSLIELNSSRDQIDASNSNIESAVYFDTKYYYLSRSLTNLNPIFIKCSQIKYLALNTCYLNEH